MGSKDERPDRQGFAHLFEHMMFRGTDRVAPNAHADLIQSVGGEANASTSFDTTNFDNELPANQVELALWLEAERMAFLRIDDRNFQTERKVVEEERREAINRPYGLVQERIFAGIFRQHPYRWPTIGSIPHLRAATLEEVQAFWADYYVPSNAVLVIVGDIEHAKAQSLADRYFGWLPAGSRPARTKVEEPPQQERRDLRIAEACGTMPIVGVVVRTVPSGHPDAVPLRLLVWILAERYPSRLYRDLMWDHSLAHRVYPFPSMELEDCGLMGVAAQLRSPGHTDQAMAAIEAQLDRLMEAAVTDAELESGRRWLVGQEAAGRRTVSSVAHGLGRAATLGDASRVNRYPDEIRSVTSADLLRAARTYFAVPNRTRIRVQPGATPAASGEGAEPVPPADGNRMAARTGPKAGLKRPAAFPASPPIQRPLSALPSLPQSRHRLENGLEIVVVPDHDVPLVSCYLTLRFGSRSEEEPGAAQLAMSMLPRATARRDVFAMLEACEREGVRLRGDAEPDSACVSTKCLARQVDSILELLAEMARFPRLEQESLDEERESAIRWLRSRGQDADFAAHAAFFRHLYGTHPYGRPATGEADDVTRLALKDVLEWWGRFGRPDAAVLYVAGDVAPDAIFLSAEKHFGAWKAEGALPEPRAPSLPRPEKRRIVILNRPGSVQSEIRVGQVALTRTHADWPEAKLLSTILGGSPTSRLATALRHQGGLAYGVWGGFDALQQSGTFSIRTSTETPRTAEAVQAILDVVARLREDAPTSEEILSARNLLAGTLARRWQTPEAVVEDLCVADMAGLKPDFIRATVKAYETTTPADLLRIARTQIDPDTLLIVVVGDAPTIRAGLEKIAPVTVE